MKEVPIRKTKSGAAIDLKRLYANQAGFFHIVTGDGKSIPLGHELEAVELLIHGFLRPALQKARKAAKLKAV